MKTLDPFPSAEIDKVDLLIVAGEASGDEHGSLLVEELLERKPDLSVSALGGPGLEAKGASLLFNLVDHSVVGIFEVLKNYGFFKKLFRQTLDWIEEKKPKVVLLIDSTVFGSAKNCLLISNTGSLYIHNDWTAFQSGAHSLSWDMLRESAQQIDAKKLKQEVAFGAVSFNTTGCSLSAKQVEMIIIMVIKRLLELQVANSEG